jgi:hypothetical protein
MPTSYFYKRLLFERTLTAADIAAIERQIVASGAGIFGLFEGVIGVPSNELVAMATWSDVVAAAGLQAGDVPGLLAVDAVALEATSRPATTTRQRAPGLYAHRWFHIQAVDWPGFLALSEASWPAFERAFDASVAGLWRQEVEPESCLVLLITRYPDLATWERSRTGYDSDEERAMRDNFRQRHRLVNWTSVVATRLAD